MRINLSFLSIVVLLTQKPLSLKGHIIKHVYHRKAPLVLDNSVNLGLIKGNDTTAGEWNFFPLQATDPWLNENVCQAGDSMGLGWWKISKCCAILRVVKPFSQRDISIVLHLIPQTS